MKMNQSAYKVLCPLAAIAAVISLATPAISQMQLNSAHRQPIDQGTVPFESIQSPRVAPEPNPQDRFGVTPLDPPDDGGTLSILVEECSWTNGGYAKCLVWECPENAPCVLDPGDTYGEYCVDAYGNAMPCP